MLLLVGKGLWLAETVVEWVGREVLHDGENVGQAVVAARGADCHLPWDVLAAVGLDLLLIWAVAGVLLQYYHYGLEGLGRPGGGLGLGR